MDSFENDKFAILLGFEVLESRYGKSRVRAKVKDDYGNVVWIPAGFKLAESSPTTVNKGITIIDVNHPETAGSEFVWVPVGNIKISQTETEQIKLDRYSFDSQTRKVIGQGTNAINDFIESDIGEFKQKTENAGGYYIAKYEARDGEIGEGNIRYSTSPENHKVVITKNDTVYNYITQNQARNLSKNMYNDTSNFTSDLVNSYAWDTALVFIQKCANSDYPYQTSSNQMSISLTGTTNDNPCNIFDMASNCFEFSTEVSTTSTNIAGRGGSYQYYTDIVSLRYPYATNSKYEWASFRPILYLNIET